MTNVTRILSQIESGDPKATERLLPLVYDELRKLAARRLAHEKPGHTLASHGAGTRGVSAARWPGPGKAVGPSRPLLRRGGQAMRRILVETARRKQGLKHGGGIVATNP